MLTAEKSKLIDEMVNAIESFVERSIEAARPDYQGSLSGLDDARELVRSKLTDLVCY